MIDVNEIIDNEFMNRDVSLLVKDDFYLFKATDKCLCFYRNGCISCVALADDTILHEQEYLKGTLEELSNELNKILN